MKTHNIAISVESVGLRKRVDVVEGDSGRKIRCKMEDMTIPTDSVARIYAEKPSGLKVYNDCTISDGYVVAELTTQMTAEVGSTQCQIEITSGDENVTSFEFELKVHKKLKDSGSIESTNEFTALEEALKKAESYANGNVPETDIAAAVAAYLEANPPSVDTDTTLTVGGKAADAKATGEKINELKSANGKLSEEIVTQAKPDEDGIVSFKNSQGLVLFTLDLSEFGGSANVYGDIVLSKEFISIGEGSLGTFTVKLASAPTTSQPVYLAISDNTKLSVSPSTLTFTPENWETEQAVTLVALQDDDTVAESVTVSLTSKKVSAKSLLVSIADDDIDLVEDGMTLYFNLRNGDLTDSVGGVVATNGGTVVDGGIKLDSSSTKFQFLYPVKKENLPNGATIELALTGLADFQGAGNGYGNGYAYKTIFYSNRIDAGFSYTANGSTASDGFSFETTENPNTFIDFTTENHICFVYNADGSANVYFNGELFKTRAVPDGFEHYNASGNITFKIPYQNMGEYNSYPITLSEIRIYERALTSDEVKNNYDATVSHRETVNF